jgi:short-subunit dehydrogenase
LKKVTPSAERVLILGASSGIGRSLAHKYASRRAQICIVGRRQELLQTVAQECTVLGASNAIAFTGDFSRPEDTVVIRDRLEQGAFSSSTFQSKANPHVYRMEWP